MKINQYMHQVKVMNVSLKCNWKYRTANHNRIEHEMVSRKDKKVTWKEGVHQAMKKKLNIYHCKNVTLVFSTLNM